MNEPLYALAGRYADLRELAEQGEPIDDALLTLEDEIEAKCTSVVKILLQLDADADALRGEEARLSSRRKAITNNAERLREYLRQNMAAAGIKRIRSSLFSITLSPGQPRVLIIDLAQVPPELTRVVPESREADKPAILKLHKETGEIPPGCDIQETIKLTVR